MNKNLLEKLKDYQSITKNQLANAIELNKIGVAGSVIMASMITSPVELSSQVVCGNQGTPTRTIGPCTGDLDFLNTYDCAFFDFDGDGNDELQIYYYAWFGVGSMAYAYVDPINDDLAWFGKGNYTFGFTFPGNPIAQAGAYFLKYQDRIYVVPLTGGNGYGFVTFDSGAHPAGTNHPNTGQPICCYHSALPQMWGAQTGINDLSEIEITTGALDECPVFPTLLPVELSNFEISKEKESAVLSWTTESEINNSGFEVQRSLDGRNYQNIGFVNGEGNSNVQKEYRFVDVALKPGRQYYYRLKQIDFDGRFEFSEIRTIILNGDLGRAISVFPNPSVNSIQIELPIYIESTHVRISVYNSVGKLMASTEDFNERGSNSFELKTTNYAQGTFFIKVETDDYSLYDRFVVSR